MSLTPEQDAQLVSLARGMAMDAPLAANSGHQGTAMALAPLAHVLFSRVMNFDPADPHWPDRDRFILSNGHASILQYTMLYLSGSGLELDDLRNFRQWESRTPGHPEAGHTAAVEVTTGPLGQGFGNSVGMAIAERSLRTRFGPDAQDHYTFAIAGDGCMMEGISHEAASLAGHLGLGRLICVFDDNRITIDGSTDLSTNDDIVGRFRAYNWDVVELGDVADDLDVLEEALLAAKAQTDKPSLLVLRTHIGRPSPDFEDDHAAHGNPFKAADVTRTKAAMGIPDEPFWAPGELVAASRANAAHRGTAVHTAWTERSSAITSSAEWQAAWAATGLDGWDDDLPVYEQGDSVATRKAIQKALDATYDSLPGLVSGSADLSGSNGTVLDRATSLSTTDPGGRYVHFGIREHAMAASMVGMAKHGGILPIGGTFFVFSDYMKPSIRLAALSKAKVCFVFTHDSVGVGEDGPTHQPVEQLAALRAIPDLHVIRPADANETIHAWADAVRHDGPSALILSRQNITVTTDGSAVERGAGIVVDVDDPAVVLLATGSEVAVCVAAAEQLAGAGVAARVVSLPSWDRFAEQGRSYRDELLPPGVPVLSVEAASTFGWGLYADASIGIDRFGASAPGELVLEKLGINVDNVVSTARTLVSENS